MVCDGACDDEEEEVDDVDEVDDDDDVDDDDVDDDDEDRPRNEYSYTPNNIRRDGALEDAPACALLS